MSGARISAMIAATQLSDALAEVLRFASEGRATESWSFDPDTDPVAQIAGALARLAEISIADMADQPGWAEDRELLGQLLAACRRFVDGWEFG